MECSLCHNRLDAGRKNNLCDCGGPLLARYDLDKIRQRWRRRDVRGGPASMWRYAPVLPAAEEAVVSLGEGWTPLIRTRRLGARLGADSLWVKDEGLNPTAFLQGPRPGVRHFDVRGAGDPEGRDSLGRERRQRPGRLRRRGRHRSAHLHARETFRNPITWSAGHTAPR